MQKVYGLSRNQQTISQTVLPGNYMSGTVREIEKRAWPCEVNLAQEASKLRLCGYAAVFYDGSPSTEFEWDSIIERINPNAFDSVIYDNMKDIVATFNHDLNNLLGRRLNGTLRIAKDNKGLIYEIDMPGTELATDLAKLVARGDVRGSSIAFVVRKERFEESGGKLIRWLDDVDLFELGPVVLPAFSATTAELANWRDYIKARSLAFFQHKEIRGIVLFEPTPTLDSDEWDADTALSRIREWAGGNDNIDWEKYRRAFAWYDEANANTFEAYKLPHHDIVDGELVVSRAGVIAAMGALLGAHGGIDIPDADREGVYQHLAQHYAQFEIEPPDMAGLALARLRQRTRIAEMKLKLAIAQI